MDQLLDDEERSVAYYGILLVLSLLALFNGGINHNIVNWSYLLIIIIGGYYIYINELDINFSYTNPLLYYGLFCLWSGLSIIWSITPHWTVLSFLKLILYGLLFLLASKIDKEEINKLIKLISLLAAGLVLLGILKYLFVSQGRIRSTFYNPNPFGLYIAMVFCLIWGIKLRADRKTSITAVILLIGLFLSGSRGAIIALGLALPFLFRGLKKEKLYISITKTLVTIIIALILVQGIVVSAPYLQENFESKRLENLLIRSEGFISSSVMGRLEFWEKAIALFKDKPITGYGSGSYHIASYLKYDGGVWYARFAHNHYVQTLSELGLIGGLLFIIFLFFLFRIILSRKNSRVYLTGIPAACIVFVLHIGIDFSWHFSAVTALFFVLAGIIYFDKQGVRKSKAEHNKRYLIVVLILLIIASAPIMAKKLSSRGYNLLLKGNINKANYYYKLAAKLYPVNAKTNYYISQNYLNLFNQTGNRGYLKQSLQEAKKAVNLSPIKGEYQNHLGKIYWKLGNYKKAERHLQLGVEYGTYLIKRYLDLGYFYYKRERVDAAISILKEGLKLKKTALIAANKSYKQGRTKEVMEVLIETNSLLAQIYKQNKNREQLKIRVEEIQNLKSKINAQHNK